MPVKTQSSMKVSVGETLRSHFFAKIINRSSHGCLTILLKKENESQGWILKTIETKKCFSF